VLRFLSTSIVAVSTSIVAVTVLGMVIADGTRSAAAESGEFLVAIIGDSYTAGSDEGGYGSTGWPVLLQSMLANDRIRISEQVLAEGGSGYAQRGTGGGTLGDKVSSVNPNSDLVVFFGSRNDVTNSPGRVRDEAALAWAAAKGRAPHAKILAIGPAWSDGEPPADLLAIRDQLRAQADTQALMFVDPLGEQWFAHDPELIGADGIHPTDAGHRFLASAIAPRIEQALRDSTETPP
jgi:lysophospholipase L1-like esterase